LFGGLAARESHTAAITMRLMVDGGLALPGCIAGACGAMARPKPTWPGDALYVESAVVSVTPSPPKLGRCRALVRSEARNQKGDMAQQFSVNVVVQRKSH
jgi:acyl dehydratase